MAIPALCTTQNLGPPRTENRTEVNTKEYASVRLRNQIREALQSALRGFKEIPQKCSTNSIWIHFFKALAKTESTHTSLPLLCTGIITKQLWKIPIVHTLYKSQRPLLLGKWNWLNWGLKVRVPHITPRASTVLPGDLDSVFTSPFPQEDWSTLFLDTVQGYTTIIHVMGLLASKP